MTRQETINKLKQIVKDFENVKDGSCIDWTDFEIEKLIVVGRPGKNLPYSPVFVFDTDLGVLRTKEIVEG